MLTATSNPRHLTTDGFDAVASVAYIEKRLAKEQGSSSFAPTALAFILPMLSIFNYPPSAFVLLE